MSRQSLLVVLAHPDDESFPLGGTLAKYAAEGMRIILVTATHGEAGIPGLNPVETARLREAELRAAARVLGIAEVRLLSYRDGEVSRADPEVVINQLVAVMAELQPHAVITFGPDGISGHPDHLAVHRLTTQAFDRAGIPARLFYIAPSEATQQGCGVPPVQSSVGGPMAAIDVSAYLVTKAQAMQCHASQNPPYRGDPEEAAAHLVCHEYFTLARPDASEQKLADLFDKLIVEGQTDICWREPRTTGGR
jgi:LmbE family N-acetylglucosaminyl deacetylase